MQANEAQIARRIGEAVRRHRQARGWSQATLAEKLDVSVDYVGLLERGERLPAIGTLVALAQVLAVTSDELLAEQREAKGWPDEAAALLRSVPEQVRPVVFAMLRAAAGIGEREAGRAAHRRRRSR